MQSILFCFCSLLFSCSNDPKIIETFVSRENLPSETIKEAELTYTEKGKVKVKIISKDLPELFVYIRRHPLLNYKKLENFLDCLHSLRFQSDINNLKSRTKFDIKQKYVDFAGMNLNLKQKK